LLEIQRADFLHSVLIVDGDVGVALAERSKSLRFGFVRSRDNVSQQLLE